MRRNQITDVPGVTVGHVTLKEGTFQTGVTAIFPHQGNLFQEKLPAAVYVANGFGKSTGLIQIEELGNLESPILLTNTFGVGTATNALIRDALQQNPEIGTTTGTINPIVMECNDGEINDIRGMGITEAHVREAMTSASSTFEEGAIGAGTGMVCYQLKGGIGSASVPVKIGDISYTLGCLVLTNYGQLADLIIDGYPIGQELVTEKDASQPEKGSVIIVLATDLPLDSRQLKRVCKRASIGITRTGAFIGNGSGEITLAFSTSHRIAHGETRNVTSFNILNENLIDDVFKQTVAVVEEAVLHSLCFSQPTHARTGELVPNLVECVGKLQQADDSQKRRPLYEKLTTLQSIWKEKQRNDTCH